VGSLSKIVEILFDGDASHNEIAEVSPRSRYDDRWAGRRVVILEHVTSDVGRFATVRQSLA